jgi:hypothetical protein
MNGAATRPNIDDTLIILPWFWRTSGKKAFVTRIAPNKLTDASCQNINQN